MIEQKLKVISNDLLEMLSESGIGDTLIARHTISENIGGLLSNINDSDEKLKSELTFRLYDLIDRLSQVDMDENGNVIKDFVRLMYYNAEDIAGELRVTDKLQFIQFDKGEPDKLNEVNKNIIVRCIWDLAYQLLYLSREKTYLDKFHEIWQECLLQDVYTEWFSRKESAVDRCKAIAEFWTNRYHKLRDEYEVECKRSYNDNLMIKKNGKLG